MKARLFNFVARHSYVLKGRFSKEVFDENTSIDEFRNRCEKAALKSKINRNITVHKEYIEGIRCEFLVPDNAPAEKLILYFHGGGYVSGSCDDHRAIVSKLAYYAGFSILLFEYRLAPENPFPAALEDSVKIYTCILAKGFERKNIMFAGESAGGGLCLATLLALKDRRIELPVAAVAISPWTDLTCSGKSYKSRNRLSPAPLNCWNVFADHYAAGNTKTLPYMSPIFGDLWGLPPLFINSGVDDELYDEGAAFYSRAVSSAVDINFRSGIGMIHCYPLLAPYFKEASDAMTEIVNFIKGHLQNL